MKSCLIPGDSASGPDDSIAPHPPAIGPSARNPLGGGEVNQLHYCRVLDRVPYKATQQAAAYEHMASAGEYLLDNVRSANNIGAFFRGGAPTFAGFGDVLDPGLETLLETFAPFSAFVGAHKIGAYQ